MSALSWDPVEHQTLFVRITARILGMENTPNVATTSTLQKKEKNVKKKAKIVVKIYPQNMDSKLNYDHHYKSES